MRLIAIDPGTVTGYATLADHGTWDLTPRKARKRPLTEAEPEYSRVGKLSARVRDEVESAPSHYDSHGEPCFGGPYGDVWVVVEGAAAFQRGKAAVRVSHELRGAVKSACWATGARYLEIQPQDLKRFATGKANADKSEMIAAARQRLGYAGNDDNEADALWLLEWARKHVAPQNAGAA